MQGLIFIGPEHVLADVLQRDEPLKTVHRVQNREYVSGGFGDNLDKAAEGVVYLHRGEVCLDHVGDLKQGQHGLVAVVGQKFSSLGYTFGVDGIFLDNSGRSESDGRGKDQRQEQVVTS